MSSHMTIQSFAMEVQMSVEYLIQQFLNIGINKTKFDFVTQSEKDILLKYMRYNNIAIFNKFSLQRKTRSTVHVSSIGGKNKRIEVEVRKNRIYMIQSTAKKNDSFDDVKNKLKNKNQLDTNDKSVDVIIKNNSSKCYNNTINPSESLNKTLKQDEQCNFFKDNSEDNLDTRTFYKSKPISHNIYHKEQNLNNQNHDLFKLDSKAVDLVNNNKINNTNKLGRFSTAKIKNDNCRLESDRRNNSRARLKYKIVGKPIRKKRNNNDKSYIHSIHDEFYTEEKVCVINRINRNKHKPSTLIHSFNKPVKMVPRNISIGETISVLELSDKMAVKSSYMIKIMMKLGLMVTINQILDQETAQLVIEEMGHNAILCSKNELEKSLIIDNSSFHRKTDTVAIYGKNDSDFYKIRPPIVTVMGHVDHGKTSLLDCIRSINTVNSEFGGITQSIKSYQVRTKNGNIITFLDTPGHEAFSKMRMRGAQLTDIIVLVIAADDGVMPQTIEAIQHIQSINVPVVVAVNKIDKLETNVDLIKHSLNKYGLIPEEWGGNTQFVNVSARSGFGINNLLDAILLQSEMLELKTIHCGIAKAVVIEASLDKGRGPIVTVLVREGELKCGDVVLCGTKHGRVKAMRDEFGHNIFVAGPSVPVELLGLSGIPDAGETMIVVQNEKKAKEVAFYRQDKRREMKLTRTQEKCPVQQSFDSIISNIKIPELNFIVKSDTKGSIEAICESLKKLSTNKIIIKIIFSSIGNITETDSVLASTTNAVILAFNVKADSFVRRLIALHCIKVYYFSVIYDLLNEVKNIINHTFVSKNTYNIIGIVEVQNTFRSLKHGTIAGCIVIEGVIKPHKKIKIIRNNIMIHEGELESLRRFKNDVNEVKIGVECGIAIKNYNDICSGDIIKVLDKSNMSCG